MQGILPTLNDGTQGVADQKNIPPCLVEDTGKAIVIRRQRGDFLPFLLHFSDFGNRYLIWRHCDLQNKKASRTKPEGHSCKGTRLRAAPLGAVFSSGIRLSPAYLDPSGM